MISLLSSGVSSSMNKNECNGLIGRYPCLMMYLHIMLAFLRLPSKSPFSGCEIKTFFILSPIQKKNCLLAAMVSTTQYHFIMDNPIKSLRLLCNFYQSFLCCYQCRICNYFLSPIIISSSFYIKFLADSYLA